jgi:uncharacterized protein YaaQ
MKMIFAVVNNDDSAVVNAQLVKDGFFVTKLASTGGFLKKGNTTFILGVDDEKVESAVDIIRRFSKKRTYTTPIDVVSTASIGGTMTPIEVTVGGATVFIMNIEHFENF